MSVVDIDRIDVFMAVRRAERPARRAAFSLALPLIAFLVLAFVAPILYLLVTAVANPETRAVLPRTLAALESWHGALPPDEPVYAALAADLKAAKDSSTAALLGKRLNYEISGMRSRVLSAARMVDQLEAGPYKERFIALHKDWGSPDVWAVIKRNGASLTPYYLLTALDLRQAPDGALERAAGDQAIFLDVLGRTLFVAGLVTLFTLLLGYPVAYVLTIAPKAIAGIMMLLVLLPLWTSLLVRTTAWVVLLQSNGVQLECEVADVCLPVEIETALAMCLREAVTNIQRHARAARVRIALEAAPHAVVLRVEDDGRGGAIVPGNGLAGMRERLAAIGAQLRIDSQRGRGTKLAVTAPLPQAESLAFSAQGKPRHSSAG